MVCMGWSSDQPEKTRDLLERYLNGYTLNEAERHILGSALKSLEHKTPIQYPKDDISQMIETIKGVKKRRGCPPGGWPKKDKPVEHD